MPIASGQTNERDKVTSLVKRTIARVAQDHGILFVIKDRGQEGLILVVVVIVMALIPKKGLTVGIVDGTVTDAATQMTVATRQRVCVKELQK